jgi:hypothetical protein
MTSAAFVKQGWSVARRVRSVVWVLLLLNLGLAAAAGYPIYRGIMFFTSHSLMSQTLAAGFSPDWLTDFPFASPGSLTRYASFILFISLLALPINAVLAGGVLARFRDPGQKFSLSDFFRDTGRYGWRLIHLMIIGLVCYWVVFRLVNQSLGGLVGKWLRDSLDDRPVFWARLGVGVLVILVLIFVNLVMDYARVRLLMDEGSSAIEAFLASLGFCIGRLRKAYTVYALPSLCGLAVLGLYLLSAMWVRPLLQGIPQGRFREPFMLALLFIGQQVIMFARYWVRVATWASEWTYFQNSRLEARK